MNIFTPGFLNEIQNVPFMKGDWFFYHGCHQEDHQSTEESFYQHGPSSCYNESSSSSFSSTDYDATSTASLSATLFTLFLVVISMEAIVFAMCTIYSWCQLPTASEHTPEFWWIRDHTDDDDDDDDLVTSSLLSNNDDDDDGTTGWDSSGGQLQQRHCNRTIEAMIEERSWAVICVEKQKQCSATTRSLMDAKQSTEGIFREEQEGWDLLTNDANGSQNVDGNHEDNKLSSHERPCNNCVPQNYDHPVAQSCSDSDDDDCCAICLNPYLDTDIVAGSKDHYCRHLFHKRCLVRWLERQSTCPCCRQEWQQTFLSSFSRRQLRRRDLFHSISSPGTLFNNMNLLSTFTAAAWPSAATPTTVTTPAPTAAVTAATAATNTNEYHPSTTWEGSDFCFFLF